MREVLRRLVVDVVADELDRRLARRIEWLTVEEYAERRAYDRGGRTQAARARPDTRGGPRRETVAYPGRRSGR
jgi:hypothetical protein